ncbi:MAG TPA: ABC transporter permease subunit [Actinoplanes sp.]|nr:ABC transporter permease subunit [Actinoplanes sp.]
MTGFARQVHAEWTKLRTVRRWVIALGGAVILSVLLSVFAASASRTDANSDPRIVAGPDGGPVADDVVFAHQRLTGDVTVTAHVVAQADSHEWAAAGIMAKDGTTGGSRYAAIAVTPRHGTRLLADFTHDELAGSGSWLRLVRSGPTVTGFWSADGRTWQQSGIPARLPATVEIGLFVTSPPRVVVERGPGSTAMGELRTEGRAVFDAVSINGTTPRLRVTTVGTSEGMMSQSGGTATVTGSGAMGPNPPPDDVVQVSLFGMLAGVLVLVAVGTLFLTSETRRGLLRTTLTANPHRGRVLAAKAVVLGGVAFGVALAAGVTAFAAAQPLLRDRGWTPPAFPYAGLSDPPVWRALLMTAAFAAAVAVFTLAVATITRHSAATIAGVAALLVLPLIVGSAVPHRAAQVLMLVTPAGGFATQRVKPPTEALVDPTATVSGGWGLAVAVLYAAAALAGAGYVLRRRDA